MRTTRIIILLLILTISSGVYAQKRKGRVTKHKAAPVIVEETPEEMLFKSMLPATAKVMFIDSVVVDKKNFLTHLPIYNQPGGVYDYETFFHQKSQVVAYVYQNEFADRAYFAQGDTIHGTSLYSIDNLGGKWSSPRQLIELEEECKSLNSPYMLSDGITLFYSATGANSIGGYDIFMTLLDSETGKFYKPENYGLPFNSTANDYLLAFDEYHELGWLVSDRFQPDDKVCIYTFVPTPSRVSFESDNIDEEKLKQYASLASIKDTWAFGKRDEAMLRLNELRKSKEGKQKESIFFPMNDKVVYHSMQDFTSEQTKKLYLQLVELRSDIEALEQSLDTDRTKFHESPAHQQKTMRPQLLKKEEQLLSLQKEVRELEKKIRNTQ